MCSMVVPLLRQQQRGPMRSRLVSHRLIPPYISLTAAPAGTFVINQATPALAVTNSPVTYSGNPQAAVVSSSVAGTTSNVLYGGSSTSPTTAGTYAITANFIPTDTTDYVSLTAATAGTFVVSQA